MFQGNSPGPDTGFLDKVMGMADARLLFHVSPRKFRPGELVEPGHPRPDGSPSTHVYLAGTRDRARYWALARSNVGEPAEIHTYSVEPTGETEPDPEDPGTGQDFRTSSPVRVVRKMPGSVGPRQGSAGAALLGHFEASGTEDYGMSHRPLPGGAPVHDLTHEGGWPEDVYTHPQYYGDWPDQAASEGMAQLRAARGNPDHPVTIYRASPPGAPYRMHTGDWVSLSPTYAGQHAWGMEEHDPAGPWHVHRAVVPARDVRDAATMPYHEQGYWGPDIDSEHHSGPVHEATAAYRGFHQAPGGEDDDFTAPMHDVRDMMPHAYEHPEWYANHDAESRRQIVRAKGKPDLPVSIYRALPDTHHEISDGDWVSTSAAYARQHGESNLSPHTPWHVVRATVPARQLFSEGNALPEWGYRGGQLQGERHAGPYPRIEVTAVIAHFEEAAMGHDAERPYGYYTLRHRTEDLGERKPRHFIEAFTPEGSTVGRLDWYGTTGRVNKIEVADETDDGSQRNYGPFGDGRDHGRRGLATAMWDWSQEMRPKTKHSGDQSEQGKAWARGLKSRERREPPQGPPLPPVTAAAGADEPYDWADALRRLRYRKRGEPEMHRGMAVTLPPDLHAMVTDRFQGPPGRQARAIAEHLLTQGAGTHWSPGEAVSRRFAEYEQKRQPGSVKVILHARLPELEDIETDPAKLAEGAVFRHDNYMVGEKEIPLREGAPVRLTGVTWYGTNNRKVRGDVHGMEHTAGAAAEEYGPRPEWQRTPEGMSDEERSADFERQQGIKNDWSRRILHGMSTGKLDPHRAKELGYYFDGHQTDNWGHPTWKPLPQHLYHVTTDLPGVMAHGLRTRDELGQQRGGHGLGGGPDDMISLTDDHQTAHAILRAVHEFHHVVNGRYTPAEMWEDAQSGHGAKRPFHEDLASYWQSGWKDGDPLPRGLHNAIHGVRRDSAMGVSQEDIDKARGPGWRPARDDEGWMSGHTPPRKMHAWWERDMEPDERRENAADFYKNFAAYREWAGGHMNPTFFSTDTKAFADKDPRHFAIVHVRPRPGAMGHQVTALGEWRTGTGDALEVTGAQHRDDHEPREASVQVFAALANPHTHGQDWFHGSPHAFGHFYEGNGSGLEFEDDPYDATHWNTLLGNHFAASHEMAEGFSRGEHGSGMYGEEGPAGNVVHARLEVKNPRVYDSEHDMDQEVYEHEFRAGNHHDQYHDPDELAEAREYGMEDELPRTYRYAGHGDRMRGQQEPDEEYKAMGNFHPYATGWLNAHPGKYGIAQRHRERLEAQGHDGIVYGNEFEHEVGRGKAGGAHLCAVPFHAAQVDVTQRHTGPQCLPEHEASRQWPGRNQPMLPGMEHEGALVAHFESGPLPGGPHMQQKLFHMQPDPTLNAPGTRHNPADPLAGVRHRQEHEEGYVPPPATWDDPVKGNRDDDGHYQHPGHGGYYCHACSGYQGEPVFHDSAETSESHETAYTDWDEEYPRIPATVHRGLRLDGGAHLADGEDHEAVARAILHHVGDDHMHWTGDEGQARHYAGVGTGGQGGPASLNVVLHARKPAREDIEEDPEVLADRNVYGIGYHDDEEIPLRSGAPVHVTGVSWRAHDPAPVTYPDTGGWHRHDFGEPAEHTASVVAHFEGHGDSLDAFSYQAVQPYAAPPADYQEGREHLVTHHGYTPDMHMPRNLPGLQNVHRGLHLPGPAGPASHQHDDPEAHHDPVFGSVAALASAEPAVPSFTWRHQAYGTGPEGGYRDVEETVSGPFYHGGRSRRMQPGSMLRTGMPTNSWGDEGPRSQYNHFTTDLGGARTYAREAGGHVYEVEPTGDDVKMGYIGNEWKSKHPLRVIRRVPDDEEARQVTGAMEPAAPEYHGEPLYHGTRSVLEPGEHLTVEEAGRYGNNPDLALDPYVHATTDPREGHRWGERADSAQAHRRMRELGRERPFGAGQNEDHVYYPRVYEVHPTGHVEPDLEYADTEHGSWRSASPMRVGREVRPLECPDCPDAGRTVEHWPDHPHYEYLHQQEEDEDADREEGGHYAAMAVTAAYDWETDEGPFTWEEIARRHPRVYGDDDDHEPGMGEGGGEDIADAAAELYHDRPSHPYSQTTGELHPYYNDEMQFHPRTVDVNRIDYMREEASDPRVSRARRGFQDHRQRDKIPPLILVHRHGVYQVADGHHRANGAEQAHWPSVRAYVAYSPHEDEPFAGRDGEPPRRGPFHGAEAHDRPPFVDHNGDPAPRISFPGFPHTTERERPMTHEAVVAHFSDDFPFEDPEHESRTPFNEAWEAVERDSLYPKEQREAPSISIGRRPVEDLPSGGEDFQWRENSPHRAYFRSGGPEGWRRADLNNHLREDHPSPGLEDALLRADAQGRGSADHYQALDAIHRRAHGRELGEWGALNPDSPEAWELENGHRRFAEKAEGEECQRQQEDDEDRRRQRVVLHGETANLHEAEHHLRNVHGIPADAMPAFHHTADDGPHTTPYSSELEELHDLDHGEMGSYRHGEPGEEGPRIHGEEMGHEDAYSHLSEHHGHNYDELRSEEPSASRLEQYHEEAHDRERGTRWDTHHRDDPWDFSEGRARRVHPLEREDESHHTASALVAHFEDDDEDEEPEQEESYRRVTPETDEHGFEWPMREGMESGIRERIPDEPPRCTTCARTAHTGYEYHWPEDGHHPDVQVRLDRDREREERWDRGEYDRTRFCGVGCEQGHHEDMRHGVSTAHTFSVGEPEWADNPHPLDVDMWRREPHSQDPHAEPTDRRDSRYEVRNPSAEHRCHYCRSVLPQYRRQASLEAAATRNHWDMTEAGMRAHLRDDHGIADPGEDPAAVHWGEHSGDTQRHVHPDLEREFVQAANPGFHAGDAFVMSHGEDGGPIDPVFGSVRGQALVAHFGRGQVALDIAHDAVLAPCGPVEAVIEAVGLLGSWRPQDAAEAVLAVRDFPQVLTALRDALLRAHRMLEDTPAHPDVLEALYEAARALTTGISDAERAVAGLPTEASWETPGGSPNR